MGAGMSVARIGGLAVALGIGAAVFTGHGVASAETSDGSDASSTSSSSSDSSGSSTDSSASSNTTSPDDAPSTTSETKETSDTESPDASTDSSDDDEEPTDSTTTRKKKRSSDTEPSSSRASRSDDSTEATAQTTTSDTAASTETAEDSAVDDAAPTPSVEISPVAEPADSVVVETVVDKPEAPTVTKPDPGDSVTVAVSSVVSTLFNPYADTSPTAPADSPAEWTLLAAARRDFDTKPTLSDDVHSPVTTSLVIADTEPSLAESAAAVVAIDQPPLLGWMQQIPVIGPLFVTPVVAFIKQIPFIGDILHPIIGYPLGYTGGTTPRDVKVISFDGTPIYVHFFPAPGLQPGQTAPTILNGPGLSLPGETNPAAGENPFLPNQVIGMAPLLRNGYNVITWDPRGEWSSGGQLEINSPDFEARDVSAIISWLSQQPEACLQAGCDPRVGMVGASYGGGIQLVTAAIDKRVDAIVPTIAWHSLNTSLYKAEAFKTSWGTLLSAALTLTFARANPRILPAAIYGALTGQVTQADQDLLDDRGPDELVDMITAPTLLIQGTVDTLFTLQEAHENAMMLIGNGVPTKVVWYCGGHGACISSTNDGAVIQRATLQWLDRYVKGILVPTGPQFEWVDQRGQHLSSNTYPVTQGPPLVASTGAGGVLPLIPVLGGSGPQFRAFEAGPIQGLLGLLSGANAANALNLTTPAAAVTTYLVGAPQLTFTYSGTGVARHVYAQLVDDTTGLVLGNLVTPVPVTLDGQTHTVTIPMEMVAHTLRPGETVTLQLVASAVPYQTIWSLGTLNVSNMQLALPTANAAAISSPFVVEMTSAA
jgi:ABC-2 type transport system ATP-binding protein